jgi:hypothetical protein
LLLGKKRLFYKFQELKRPFQALARAREGATLNLPIISEIQNSRSYDLLFLSPFWISFGAILANLSSTQTPRMQHRTIIPIKRRADFVSWRLIATNAAITRGRHIPSTATTNSRIKILGSPVNLRHKDLIVVLS